MRKKRGCLKSKFFLTAENAKQAQSSQRFVLQKFNFVSFAPA